MDMINLSNNIPIWFGIQNLTQVHICSKSNFKICIMCTRNYKICRVTHRFKHLKLKLHNNIKNIKVSPRHDFVDDGWPADPAETLSRPAAPSGCHPGRCRRIFLSPSVLLHHTAVPLPTPPIRGLLSFWLITDRCWKWSEWNWLSVIGHIKGRKLWILPYGVASSICVPIFKKVRNWTLAWSIPFDFSRKVRRMSAKHFVLSDLYKKVMIETFEFFEKYGFST